MRRDVYFNGSDVLFLSGGCHLENDMYISTGEMYISIWRPPDIYIVEIYIFVLEIYISSQEKHILSIVIYISCFGTNGLP